MQREPSIEDNSEQKLKDNKHFRKETVIIRHWLSEDCGEDLIEADRVDDLEILGETEFSERCNNRTFNAWKSARYMQTCIKSRTGLGKPIII